MKLILLGGISLKNKGWIEQVGDELKSDFEIEILYYDHWKTGGEDMNFETEGQKLEKMARGEYAVFAKSGGGWITLKLAAEGRIKPVKIILVGPAWDWARNNGFDPAGLAKKVTVPVLVVDKTNDPALAFTDLQKEAGDLPNFKLVEVPGDTHHYEGVVELGKLVREFLGQ